MRIRCALACILPLFVLFLSCGSTSTVKKGDRFEALVDLKEAADIQGSLEYSDGFTCVIPKGAILEALYSSSSSDFFECRPIMLDGNSQEGYIIEKLVPEVVRRRPGFETFSVSLNRDYIGTKLKKTK